MLHLKINGLPVEAPEGSTVLEAAVQKDVYKRQGDIPSLGGGSFVCFSMGFLLILNRMMYYKL